MKASLSICSLLLVLTPLASHAQQPAQTWSGRIVDAGNSRALEGVAVRALGTDTLAAQSDADGRFTLQLRSNVEYTLQLRRVGFAPWSERIAARRGEGVADVHELRLERVAYSLDQVVITAARREQRLADAVPTIEVINRSDIERTGASDLASVLTEQSGVVLQGGHPAGAGTMLQGIGSERVLVLLDGQPMTGRLSGVFDISRIPVSVVERVEVMKGPQSTLYGTEAMGGVINIITRRPSEAQWDASLLTTAGTQARRDVAAALSHSNQAFAASVNVGHRATDMAPGRESPDGALAARSDLALQLRAGRDSSRVLEAGLLVLDERQRWRTGTYYNFGDNRQYSGRLSGTWRAGNHRFTPTISTSHYDHRSRASLATQPIAGDTGQRQMQRVYQAELLYNGRFGRNGSQALDIGTQVRRDETQTERVTGGLRSLTLVEPFVQMELALGALSLAPGVRLSSSELWGENVTSRLASRWRVNEQLTVRASAGEGFRAPDFKELFMFFQNTGAGYAVLGNPDLRPETSRNFTLGTEWMGPRQFVRAQAFVNQFRDFIETRPITLPGEAPVYVYCNVDRGFTRGVEIESGIALRGIRAEASYSGLSTRDNATGHSLLGRPAHSARATLNTMLPLDVRLSATGLYTGRVPMTRDDSTGVISAYRDPFARVDVRFARTLTWAGRPLARGVDLVLGIDNVLDARPDEWAGFTGRQFYTTLSWNLHPSSRP